MSDRKVMAATLLWCCSSSCFSKGPIESSVSPVGNIHIFGTNSDLFKDQARAEARLQTRQLRVPTPSPNASGTVGPKPCVKGLTGGSCGHQAALLRPIPSAPGHATGLISSVSCDGLSARAVL